MLSMNRTQHQNSHIPLPRQHAFYMDPNPSPQSDASTHLDTSEEITIYEDPAERENNQEHQAPLIANHITPLRLQTPTPLPEHAAPLDLPVDPPQAVPAPISPRANRNRRRRLRRQRWQQRYQQLVNQNMRGVHIQNGLHISGGSTVHIHNMHCWNSSSPTN